MIEVGHILKIELGIHGMSKHLESIPELSIYDFLIQLVYSSCRRIPCVISSRRYFLKCEEQELEGD